MSLSQRARALSDARPGDSGIRGAALLAGGIAIAAGLGASFIPAIVAGAGMIGYSFRPEADRYYLEGFSDGLAAADALAAAAPDRTGAGGGMDGVRAGAGPDAGLAFGADLDAPRPPSRRFRPAGGGAEEPRLADVVGLRDAGGPASHPTDPDGAPVARGPRSLGVVPPARRVGAGPGGEAAGPEAGAEARPRINPRSAAAATSPLRPRRRQPRNGDS